MKLIDNLLTFCIAVFLVSEPMFTKSENNNCKIVSLILHQDSIIRCFISSQYRVGLHVSFEYAPESYSIEERHSNLTAGVIDNELFLYFVPSVVQNNTHVSLFLGPELIVQEATLILNLLDIPRFECTTPEDILGKVTFNCTGINTRENRYQLDYAFYGDENPIYNVKTWRSSELEEFSYFTIWKSWLLDELTINIKFYSEFYNTLLILPINVPNISLPMRVSFMFHDVATNEHSNFTCINLENGIVPLCKSDYFDAEDYIIEIYDPNDRKFDVLSTLKLNNWKSIVFGKWKCIVANKHGKIQVEYYFQITDKPCLVNARLPESYSVIDVNKESIYRVKNAQNVYVECTTLSVPYPTEFTFYEIGGDIMFKSPTNFFNVGYVDKSAPTYWGCSAKNIFGQTHSIPIILFYEPYFVHRTNPILFMICMLPVIIALCLCSIFIIVSIYHEKDTNMENSME